MTIFQKIERALLQQVAETEDITMLQGISTVYGEEAERGREKGQRHQGYDLVQEVAAFKAEIRALWLERAQETRKRKQSELNNVFLLTARHLNEQDFACKPHNWAFADSTQTLAIETKSRLVRYIVSTDDR